jgi:hypothetical protein
VTGDSRSVPAAAAPLRRSSYFNRPALISRFFVDSWRCPNRMMVVPASISGMASGLQVFGYDCVSNTIRMPKLDSRAFNFRGGPLRVMSAFSFVR